MHTKWNMTVFLFMSLLSAALLLSAAFSKKSSGHLQRACSFMPLAASGAGLAAVLIIIGGLNHPGNIVNMLGRPFAGLSSAVIAQLLVVGSGLLVFAKGRHSDSFLWPITLGSLACLAVFCSYQVYTVSTRPALNTLTLLAVLLLVVMQLSLMLTGLSEINPESENGTKICLAIMVIGLCGIVGQTIFAARLALLASPDRVLTFSELMSGNLDFLYWSMILLTVLVPPSLTLIGWRTKRHSLRYFSPVFLMAGLFLLCVLINQMPDKFAGRIVS